MNRRQLTFGLVSLAVCGGYTNAQITPQPVLADVLREATRKRQQYVETFKDLTAVETKITEIIKNDGKVEKR